MIRFMWRLMVLGGVVAVFMLQGCAYYESDHNKEIDTTPPAAPRGVYSITGDEEVVINWYPNQEKDLKGYMIYRSFEKLGKYVEIDMVGSEASSYVDKNVKNGTTYYYAVSAIDFNDNESELSPEIVEDTPRPAGRNIKLEDYSLRPERSGFDFSSPEKGAQTFDLSNIDIYFGIDTEVWVPYIYSDNGTEFQDLGYTDSMDDVDASPTKGFTELFVEAIIGHTYAFLTPDKHYAKLRVTDIYIDRVGDNVREAWITFDWAYQLQDGNPELAPRNNLKLSVSKLRL